MSLTDDDDGPVQRVYHNDMLMMKIIENVEQFKDRNSLELTNHRFRQLCLKTPIALRESYAILLEQDPNWKPIFTLLMRPRKFASRLSVVTCSDVPKEESAILVSFSYQDCAPHKAQVFYEGVRKRLLNQISEFEIKYRRFTADVFENLQRFPKLNRIIVNNAQSASVEAGHDEDGDFDVLNRINSLELRLDNHFCMEITGLKLMIRPNIKNFCCVVNPSKSMYNWFVEEIMVEMAIQKVQLETCRLIFPDQSIPRNLLIGFIQFMSERSAVMQIFVAAGPTNVPSMKRSIPAFGLEFRDEKDRTMQLLYEACPIVFHQAKIIHITNMHKDNCDQLFDMLSNLWAVRDFHISCTPQKVETCPVDQLLVSLPTTVRTLKLYGCKMNSSSLDLLVSSGSQTIRNLFLKENASWNTVPNLVKLLEGMRELRSLEMDMVVPHLLYPKIVEHSKLEQLTGYTNRFPPEKSLQMLHDHFNHVQLKKVSSQKQHFTISDPIRSHL